MSVTEPGGHAIETMQVEERKFPPSPETIDAAVYDNDTGRSHGGRRDRPPHEGRGR